MDNALNIWGKVQTGYVSGTMEACFPNTTKRKKERVRDEVSLDNDLPDSQSWIEKGS